MQCARSQLVVPTAATCLGALHRWLEHEPARHAPPLAAGAYLLGVAPPELLQLLGLDLPLLRRDPVREETAWHVALPCLLHSSMLGLMPASCSPHRQHYFLPTCDGSGRYLLLGGDSEASRRQFLQFFSQVARRAAWAQGPPACSGSIERSPALR